MSDSNEQISPEFAELLAGFIDDKLSPEQTKRLADIIQEDPSARELYLEHCRMHATLAWEHGVLGGISFPEEEPDSTIVELPSWKRWSRPLMLAASLALVASITWMTIIPQVRKTIWNSHDAVGTVVRKSGGQLNVENLKLQLNQGDILRPGKYQFSEGLTQFVLKNQVEVLVEAPAEFTIESPFRLQLNKGRLSANVPDKGKGFTVITPNAEIVDFGTEFGVEVGSDTESEIHVFEGEVEVKTENWTEEPVRLLTDQATRVNSRAGEPIGIPVATHRFLRSFDEPVFYYSELVRKWKPVAYYRMSISEDGTTLLDRSGNNLHGRIDRGFMTSPVFGPGRIGASLRLEGPEFQAYAVVDDYPKATDDKLSVAAWVFANSRPRWASIAKNWSLNEIGQFHLGLNYDTGKLEIQLREQNGDTVFAEDPEVLPTGSWQHVAFVVDGEFVRLYRNGKEVAKAPCTSLATPTYPFLGIGAKITGYEAKVEMGSTGFWDGMIDELSIFNKALSPKQIRQLHRAEERLIPPTVQ